MEYELRCIHDGRKSFYKKALVIEENGVLKLQSYDTIVAEIINGKPKVYGTYSNTTLRHIKEFLKQHGFKADTSSQILKDYSPTKEEIQQEEKKQEEKFKGLFDSLKMVCAVGEVMHNNTKDKNEFKKRMLNAGLGNKGLNFPEDWDSLPEEEKQKRLNESLKVLE